MVQLGLAGELADVALGLCHALELVQGDILTVEGRHSLFKELDGIVIDHGQLLHGSGGVAYLLLLLPLGQVQQLLGIVADSFQIGKGLEHPVHILGIPVRHFPYIELHQEIADGIRQIVDDGFVILNLLRVGHLTAEQRLHGQLKVGADQAGHPLHLIADLQQGDAGRAHQVHVDEFQTAGILVLLLGHHQVGELYHLIGQGQQHRGGNHLEDDVHQGDLEHGIRNQPLNKLGIGQRQGDNGHNHRAHQVVDQVDHGCPLGIVPGVHGSQNGGHGRADVDAADQEGGKVQRHQALHGQCLQNTNRRGGGLDYGAEGSAHQQAQQGALGVHNELLEPDYILQRLHGAAHGVQALEQQAEAQNDLTDVLGLLFLGIEHEERADENTEGGDAGHVQGNQDAGDGGTDVGAEDDAGGLGQVHDSGIDEAHNHHRGGRGRLNHHRNKHAQQETKNPVSGQLFQQILHLGTGRHFQAVAHVLHSEQEGTQAAQQGNDVCKAHAYSSL